MYPPVKNCPSCYRGACLLERRCDCECVPGSKVEEMLSEWWWSCRDCGFEWEAEPWEVEEQAAWDRWLDERVARVTGVHSPT